MRVVLLIGTKKGAFIAHGDAARRTWRLCGPRISATWKIYDLAYEDETATLFAAGSSNWYGPAVWRSADLGETWTHSSAGLTFGDAGPAVEQVWTVVPVAGTLYAGTDPAGLFRSDDAGATWEHLPALRRHPSHSTWRASNAGLPLHAIVADAARLWVAIGAGGVYRTEDSGRSWVRCAGTTNGSPAGGSPDDCVHALVRGAPSSRPAGGAGSLYRQSHAGVWRSDDGGTTWQDAGEGLPSPFGFPLAAHPRDPDAVYAVPLDATGARRVVPGGRLAVWRSHGAGQAWERLDRGFPADPTYVGVWRRALATDALDPAGVYVGTSTGQLYASADEGATWALVAPYLPPILCVAAIVLEDQAGPSGVLEDQAGPSGVLEDQAGPSVMEA